jgi:hypothetical protein
MHKTVLGLVEVSLGLGLIAVSVPEDASIVGLPLGATLDAVGAALVLFGLGSLGVRAPALPKV